MKPRDKLKEAAHKCNELEDGSYTNFIRGAEWAFSQFKSVGTDGCKKCETGRVSMMVYTDICLECEITTGSQPAEKK